MPLKKEPVKVSGMKYKDIPVLREKLWIEQDKKCKICNQELDATEMVLDHDHKTGKIRGVLHRGCNVLLGAVENNRRRNKIDDIKLVNILQNLITYTRTSRFEIHPKHISKINKRAKKKAKTGKK